MRIITACSCFTVFFLVSGCGERTTEGTSKPVGELLSTESAGIVEFVKGGEFRKWETQQLEVRNSVSAHRSLSKVYFNDIVAAALKSGESPMPVDSILVKEMFEKDRETVSGYAVMVKVAAGTEADSWLFFEGFEPDYNDPFYGKANPTCTGCHSQGNDYVRSTLPD